MNLEADVTCPGCKKKIKIAVKEMIPGRTKNCPNCRSPIDFTGDDGRKTQKAIDDFEKSLKNMFK